MKTPQLYGLNIQHLWTWNLGFQLVAFFLEGGNNCPMRLCHNDELNWTKISDTVRRGKKNPKGGGGGSRYDILVDIAIQTKPKKLRTFWSRLLLNVTHCLTNRMARKKIRWAVGEGWRLGWGRSNVGVLKKITDGASLYFLKNVVKFSDQSRIPPVANSQY